MVAHEPSPDPQADLEAAEVLAELKQLFRSRLDENAAELNAAATLLATEPQLVEGFGPVIRLVHTLAGTAGTFDFPQISAAALALEAQLATIVAAKEGGQQGAESLQALATLCAREAAKITPS